MKKIHYRNKKRYGSPRIAKELEASGFHASEKLIRKLMKSASLESVFKRKYKITTNSSHTYPVAENILDREFNVSNTNEVWVSDITYIKASFPMALPNSDHRSF
nr:IS3 family transposase [Flavobacterium beibuense]